LAIIPLRKEYDLIACVFNLTDFTVILSYARYKIYRLPEMEINPKMMVISESLDKIKIEIIMIGRSVIIGAAATRIPSFLLCSRVSEITSVSNGPGDIPAARPKIKPVEIRLTRVSIHSNASDYSNCIYKGKIMLQIQLKILNKKLLMRSKIGERR